MGHSVRVVVAAGVVLFGGAACGGGGDGGGVASAGGAAARASASPSRSLSAEDAQLRFAQCMRQNGVDVPDPGSGHAETMRIGKGAGREKVQAALKECQPWLQAGGKMPDLKDPKVRDQFLKFAQCLREHGVDMKDPDPDGTIRIPAGKADPGTVNKAREACRALAPGAGK